MRIGISQRTRVETISYSPGMQDTGDLEAATATITATSEGSGLVNADYSAALTLKRPSDARLEVKRIAARLAVTVDSMTAGHLYCRVYVDQQDAEHLLFDEDWTGAGARLDATDTHQSGKAAIFSLLADGSAHTFYFFFWVDAGSAVISLVQLWEGAGTCSTSTMGAPDTLVMTLDHPGPAQAAGYLRRAGTGTATMRLYGVSDDYAAHAILLTKTGGDYLSWENPAIVLLHGPAGFRLNSTQAGDLMCFGGVMIRLIS